MSRVLNGLLLQLTSHNLRAAASDGHRMALCTVDGGAAGLHERERAIIPRKSVQDLERLIGDSDEDVRLAATLRPGKNPPRSLRVGECNLTVKLDRGTQTSPECGRGRPRTVKTRRRATRERGSNVKVAHAHER